MANQLQETNTNLETNNMALSIRLEELYKRLTDHQAQMADSQEDQMTSLFEAMAKDAFETSKHCLLRKRVERVLNSLRFDKISERKSAIPKAHEKTFQWSLSGTTTTLPNWLRSGNGLYWIEGKAGSGKSTLMKFLQHAPETTALLQEWADGKPLIFVSHYFWAPGTDLQRSFVGLFRTLMFQIFLQHPELLDLICPLRMNASDYAHLEPWTLEELAGCFDTLSSIDSLPSKLCIFIDGLDEFQGNHKDLIDFVQSASKSRNIKLCISSRPWIEFRRAFEVSPKLCVHELTMDDIHRYVREHLEYDGNYQRLQNDFPEDAKDLIDELTSESKGVFLWVYLAVRDLLRGLTNDDDIFTLKERLQTLPKDLESYFERMLHNIDSVYHFETSALFSMLAYTQFPLTTHITWAYRRFRRLRRNVWSFDPEDASVTSMISICKSWTQRGMKAKDRDAYSAVQERRRVIARCKDLIHVAESSVDNSSPIVAFSIAFLHRTVCDFLQVPKIKTMISERIASGSRANESFWPSTALAQAHFEVLSTLAPHAWDERTSCREMIVALARQTRKDSERDYLQIVFMLCSLNNDGDAGSHGTFISMLLEPLWMVAIERWDRLNPSSADGFFSLSSYHHHHQVDKAGSFRKDGHRSQKTVHPKFWAMHCAGCLKECEGWFGLTLLMNSLKATRVVLPSLGNNEEESFQTPSRANLNAVRALVNILEVPKSRIWLECLMTIQYMISEGMPSTDLYDVCRTLIHGGVPRFIYPLELVPGSMLDIAKMMTTSAPEPDGIDTARFLDQIPVIVEHDPDGMEKDFLAAERAGKTRPQRPSFNLFNAIGNLLEWVPRRHARLKVPLPLLYIPTHPNTRLRVCRKLRAVLQCPQPSGPRRRQMTLKKRETSLKQRSLK